MAGTIAVQGRTRIAMPFAPRAAFLVLVVVAAIAGAIATGADASARALAEAGSDLARLLRAMAALKTLMAMAAIAATTWRLGAAVRPLWFAAYAVAAMAMAAGPGLIWGMAHVAFGAVLLHAGLLATLLLLWRDPAVGQRLGAMVAARRARRA
jgi:hypothetical protein